MRDKHPTWRTSEVDSEQKAEFQRKHLPDTIDRAGTLFVYGSLLDKENLSALLKGTRGENVGEHIYETDSLEDVQRLFESDATAVVILRGVILDKIRASVVAENEFRALYEQKSGTPIADYDKKIQDLTGEEQVSDPNTVYLYARPSKEDERPRNLNGGLVVGLQENELASLDQFEFNEPGSPEHSVYVRRTVPEIIIEDISYRPENVQYYEGNVGDNPHVVGSADAKETKGKWQSVLGILGGGKKDKTGYPDTAKWPHNETHHVRPPKSKKS